MRQPPGFPIGFSNEARFEHGFSGHGYQFNSAGQLTRETSTVHAGQTLGKDVSYTYYANGYIQSLRDNSLLIIANFAYDNAGNRVYEGYFTLDPVNKDAQGNPLKLQAYQNSTITYDELNRIVRVRDALLYDIRYEFDAVGNRRMVDSIYWDGAGSFRDRQTYWYAYDALIVIGYDKLSRRVLAEYSYDKPSCHALAEFRYRSGHGARPGRQRRKAPGVGASPSARWRKR